MLWCFVTLCNILRILSSIIRNSNVLYSVIVLVVQICHIVLCEIMLDDNILYCTMIRHITLCCVKSHYIRLYHIVSYHTIPYHSHIISYDILLYSVIPYCDISYHTVYCTIYRAACFALPAAPSARGLPRIRHPSFDRRLMLSL